VTPGATTTEANSVVWEGELDFDPKEPRVVVVPQDETPLPDDGTTDDGTADDQRTEPGATPRSGY
jgi:hypothetical protein